MLDRLSLGLIGSIRLSILGPFLGLASLALLVFSACMDSPAQRVAYHTGRGDGYAREGRYREAVIEYKNACQAAPQDSALQWKLAQAALRSKDLREAFAALQKAIELDPTNDDARGRLAQLHLARGQREAAARLAQELLIRRPDSPLGYQLTSEVALLSGKVPDALRSLHDAIERDPANVPLMLTLGNLHTVGRQLALAQTWYDRAVEQAPQSPEVHLARGSHWFIIGKEQAGKEAFQMAINLNANSEESRLAVAKQYLLLGKTAAAEEVLQSLIKELQSQQARALLAELKLESHELAEAKRLTAAMLERGARDLSARYLNGRLALAERRFDEARALFTDVLKENAGIAAVHLYLGVLEIVEGRPQVGEQRLREAIHLLPEDPRPHLILADLHLKQDDAAKAEQEALAVLRHHPWSLQAALLYGDSHAVRDHWAKAEEIYRAVAEHFPSNPDGYVKLAHLKRRQGLTKRAAEYVAEAVRVSPADSALKADYLLALHEAGNNALAERLRRQYLGSAPEDPGIWIAAGRLAVARKQPAAAEEAFLTATKLAPGDPMVSYQLARFYMATGQRSKALRCLEETLATGNAIAGVHTSLGILLSSEERVEEANGHYRDALRLMPNDLVSANNLATNLSEAGNVDEALPYARRALALAPSSAAVQDTMAWILFKQGLIDEARPLMAEAAKKLPEDASVHYHYGMALFARGEKQLAAVHLRTALSAPQPTFTGADQAMATLRLIE